MGIKPVLETLHHIHGETILIFVYGSLKKGFSNHHIIEKAKFKGKAQTTNRYPMFKEENANYPYMLNISDEKYHLITGELYELNDSKLLEKIDIFEDAPEYYQRELISVQIKGVTLKAFAYFLKEKIIPKDQIPLKEWIEDDSYYLKQFKSFYNKATA